MEPHCLLLAEEAGSAEASCELLFGTHSALRMTSFEKAGVRSRQLFGRAHSEGAASWLELREAASAVRAAATSGLEEVANTSSNSEARCRSPVTLLTAPPVHLAAERGRLHRGTAPGSS
eukprot:6190182-Pleurochrysis_carterae.AAC.3